MSFLSSLGHALKSKTVWAGIGTAALGTGEILQQYAPVILSFVPPATPLAASIIIGTGVATIIGRVKAKQPLGPVIDSTIQKTVDAVHQLQGTPPAGVQRLAFITAMVKAPAEKVAASTAPTNDDN